MYIHYKQVSETCFPTFICVYECKKQNVMWEFFLLLLNRGIYLISTSTWILKLSQKNVKCRHLLIIVVLSLCLFSFFLVSLLLASFGK